MKVYADFNRALLTSVHADVKARWPHINLRKSVGVTRASVGSRTPTYFVQAHVGTTLANWTGRAEDANHAKYQAWHHWLEKSTFDQR